MTGLPAGAAASGLAAVLADLRVHVLDRAHRRVRVDAEVTEVRPGVHEVRATADGGLLQVSLPLRADEHLAGFGEQFCQVDKRGREVDGWVGADGQNASPYTKGLDGGYTVMPIWYSSAGYAAVLRTFRRWRVRAGTLEPDRLLVDVPGGELDLVLVEGPPDRAVATVSELVGRPPVPPAWVFGPWKGLRGGHEATMRLARRLRDEQLPVTAIWLDAHYQPASNSGFPGAGTYPLGEYPDMAATVAALHDLGFRVFSYLNPFLYVNTPAYEEAAAHGYAITRPEGDEPYVVPGLHPFEGDLFGFLEASGCHSRDPSHSLVDFTNPEARAWFQGNVRRVLVEDGFDGFMQDFGEEVPEDARFADGSTGVDGHNRYPVLYHGATREEVDRTKPDACFYTRSGYLGSQAFSTVLWAGDQDRDWSRDAGIGAVPAGGIAAGLVGFPTWGPDIGGTMDFRSIGGARGGGSEDVELWRRWCQLGAMSPIMRDHLGFLEGDPVDVFGVEEAAATWREAGAWHTSLFPYLWSLAHDARETGRPLLRGLMFEAPEHREAWTVNDQWLLGDALLCAPVVEAGATDRTLWLPPGGWTDVWTGTSYEGPGWVTVPAPIDRWPVLQRNGSVVPRLAASPLHLNDERWATGAFDLVVDHVPGPASSRALFDGTAISADEHGVEVTGGPARSVTVRRPGA